MISVFAAVTTIVLILIPSVPLFIYVAGLLLPEEHTVSRSATLHPTTADKIWAILANVDDYPSWQPALDRTRCSQEDKVADQRLVFTEHTKRNKRITTVIDAKEHRVLSRMTEEDSTNTASDISHKPTFIGTWTFDITPHPQEGTVVVTITEKGTITRPMVRLLHLTLLGFHRRIDRFLRDLDNKVQQDAKVGKVQENDDDVHQRQQLLVNNDTAAHQPPSPPPQPSKPAKEHDILDDVLSQESNPTTSNESSPTVDKDWDLMSEIYERPNAPV